MKIVSVTGTLWHYHMIGMGLIFTYNSASQVRHILNVHTGKIFNTIHMECPYSSVEEFEEEIKFQHISMIDDQLDSADLIFLDKPKLVGDVWIDFDILKN